MMTEPSRQAPMQHECLECHRQFKDEHGLKQHMADAHKIGRRPRAPERYPLRIESTKSN